MRLFCAIEQRPRQTQVLQTLSDVGPSQFEFVLPFVDAHDVVAKSCGGRLIVQAMLALLARKREIEAGRWKLY